MTLPTDPGMARAAAERERRRLAKTDSSLRQWNDAVAGTPVLVHTAAGAASYWLVPIGPPGDAGTLPGEPVAGFVRVTLAGRVAAAGSFGGRPRPVTGITEADARAAAARAAPHTAVDTPLFVHDGPPGREGWRVDVTGGDGMRRTLFITAGGVSQLTGGGEPQ
jgi:hypothetical protein